jgi:hypothetical protein
MLEEKLEICLGSVLPRLKSGASSWLGFTGSPHLVGSMAYVMKLSAALTFNCELFECQGVIRLRGKGWGIYVDWQFT